MTTELAGGRELPQLVPDHLLRNIDGHMAATIMHRDRVPNHLGENRGGSGPRAHQSNDLDVSFTRYLGQATADETGCTRDKYLSHTYADSGWVETTGFNHGISSNCRSL